MQHIHLFLLLFLWMLTPIHGTLAEDSSTPLQETRRTWEGAFRRSLEIGDHQREFFYKGGRLARILSQEVDLCYDSL